VCKRPAAGHVFIRIRRGQRLKRLRHAVWYARRRLDQAGSYNAISQANIRTPGVRLEFPLGNPLDAFVA